jgi:transposase
MVSGIYFVLRTGLPWRDLPKEFGPWSSVYTRIRRWCRSERWSQMLALLTIAPCSSLRSVDCTHIKAHQDASNAAGGAAAEANGKTKGGMNTKLAAVVDCLGRAVDPLLDKFADCWVIADHGFDAKDFHQQIISRGSIPCIPPRVSSRIQHHFSKLLNRHRHVVENFFVRIKRRRRIGTRYEKLSETFLGFVMLATILDWLHFEV